MFKSVVTGAVLLCVVWSTSAGAQQARVEKLDYEVEWHLITAGLAHLEVEKKETALHANLKLESAGAVSRLYRVLDHYTVDADGRDCPNGAELDALEGNKHIATKLQFDTSRKQLWRESRDYLQNTNVKNTLTIPPCTHEIVTALLAFRSLHLEPGQSGTILVTDGKKVANARVEAQAKEQMAVNGKQVTATRYEAFLFDNVLYRRKGRLLIWISDDPLQVPLQLRFQMGFPVGNVVVRLTKQVRS